MKKYWAFGIIFFIWVVFASPYFGGELAPFPSTYQHNFFDPWQAYNHHPGPYKNGAMSDIISQIYPWKHFTIETLKQGEIPFWNPYSFSGTPHLANYQSAVLTPFNLLFFILPFVDAWSLLILIQPLLAGIFMYLFIRSLRVSRAASLVGAISFMFCGFITVWMEYGTLGYAIIFLPLALFSIEKFLETKYVRFLLLLGITVPLSFFSGHFQTSLYFSLTVLAYIIWHGKEDGRWFGIFSKRFLSTRHQLGVRSLGIAFFAGMLLAMPQIIPSMEFYNQTLRSNIFQKGEVIQWAYIPTLLAPDFFGNPVTRNDWFGHYAEWNSYVGIVALLFAIYCVVRLRTSKTWFFISLAVASFLLAFPTPLFDLIIFLHIPVLSTSAASRVIVLFSFAVIVLGSFGIDRFLMDMKHKYFKPIFFVCGGFTFVFGILWFVVLHRVLIPIDKIPIARQNLILPTLLFLAVCTISLLVIFFRQKRSAWIFCICIFLLSFLDLFRFSTKWLPFEPKKLIFSDTPITKMYKKISDHDRAFGNFGAEDSIYYHLPGLEGYDALYPRWIGEFMAYLDKGEMNESEKSLVRLPKQGLFTSQALDVLDVRYIVHKVADAHASWTLPFWSYPNHIFTKVAGDNTFEIFRNEQAFPRAFLISDYDVVSHPSQALSSMFDTNLRMKALLEDNPHFVKSPYVVGSVTSEYTSPNHQEYRINTSKDALLVMTDSYYPGWEARVDGHSTPIIKTDFAFRSILIPKGSHKVIVSYFPQSFVYGLLLAMSGVLLLVRIMFLKKG